MSAPHSHKIRALAASALTAFACAATSAPAFDVDAALAAGTAAVGTTVSAHQLTDRRGATLSLADLRGKPVLVQPVYTSCYHSCNVLTRYLALMVAVARDALGEDAFHVLTIGFDTATDSPERMAEYARRHDVDDPRWRFASASPATVAALTREIGFRYVSSPQGFDHLAQVTLLDGAGRVHGQIYGDAFPAPTLVEPLKSLVFASGAEVPPMTSWVNRLKLLCTVYDPSTGAYTFDYSIFVSAAIGALCLGGIAVFLVRAWREHERPARPLRSRRT